MRLFCAPIEIDGAPPGAQRVVLFDRPGSDDQWTIGNGLPEAIRRKGLDPAPRAWDFLAIALAVIAADLGFPRNASPDGWTRQIELDVAVVDAPFWSKHRALLERLLSFLTTDIWQVSFVASPWRYRKPKPKSLTVPSSTSVMLLSGGLDSFVGAVDLSADDLRPYAVSHISRGDREKQAEIAAVCGLPHIQLNHNFESTQAMERSERARSLLFIAYAVLLVATLKRRPDRDLIPLFICENGFISLNPPLTRARLGSLSTRTTHPVCLAMCQRLLQAAGIPARLVNPYQFKTKGEMLSDCKSPSALAYWASRTTSCSRFARNGYKHCGRCVPCLVRRAALHSAGLRDRTSYVYRKLSRRDGDHAGFDDVRAVLMAIAQRDEDGMDSFLGATLSGAPVQERARYVDVVRRGLDELGAFLKAEKVR